MRKGLLFVQERFCLIFGQTRNSKNIQSDHVQLLQFFFSFGRICGPKNANPSPVLSCVCGREAEELRTVTLDHLIGWCEHARAGGAVEKARSHSIRSDQIKSVACVTRIIIRKNG